MPIAIVGMDPMTFTVTTASILGFMLSIINFLRHYTPLCQYLAAADSIAQARAILDALEKENLLPEESLLGRHLDLLERDVLAFMFVTVPTTNFIEKLRRWMKAWELLQLAHDVSKFRIGLLTVSEQRRHIERAVKLAERDGQPIDLAALEEKARATTALFMSSLADLSSAADHLSRDLEANTDRSDSNDDHLPTRPSSDSDSSTLCTVPKEEALSSDENVTDELAKYFQRSALESFYHSDETPGRRSIAVFSLKSPFGRINRAHSARAEGSLLPR